MPDLTPEEIAAEEARVAKEHEEAQAKADAERAAEAEADAAFEAGYEGKRETPTGNAPVPENQTLEQKPDATPEGEPDASKKEDPLPESATLSKEQADKLLGLLTQHEQLKSNVDRQLSTAFGKVGGIERILKEMQTSKSAGQPVKLDKNDWAELKTAGFEDLLDNLIPGLERALSKVSAAPVAVPTFDADAVQRALVENQAREIARTRQQCLEDLNEVFPGWQEVVGDPAKPTPWREWLKTQPLRYQKKVNASWDADVVAESIEKFKAFETERAAKVSKPKESDTASGRKDRLREAVTKPASPSRVMAKSDEDEFQEGYNSGPAGQR